MNRIWIVGESGSGKTTLANALSQVLGAECVDLDELYWRPNWQVAPPDEFHTDVERVLSEVRWVVAGNYAKTQAQFIPLADTIIWLDYPLPFVFVRLLKRTLRRVNKQEPCSGGNFETLRLTFSRESILLWLLRTFRRSRRRGWQVKREARLAQKRFIHFRHPTQCEQWLKVVRRVESDW
ncbi:hypothetical protein IAD21_02007 [Abditibacteriota bacterium]|nr:hypothetical protein IAD21_02007 [Abditibacteriota bacterium]